MKQRVVLIEKINASFLYLLPFFRQYLIFAFSSNRIVSINYFSCKLVVFPLNQLTTYT